MISFIQDTYLPDAQALAATYADYKHIGRGYGNLLAYGCFDLNSSGSSKLLQRGQAANGSASVQAVNVQSITENMTYSWYKSPTLAMPFYDSMTPIPVSQNPAVGVTNPVDPATKPRAYSWLKAPRYGGLPYETGALARMWVNGDYRTGISVMDRHLARAAETLKVAQAMLTWADQINLNGAVAVTATVPTSTTTPSGNPNFPPHYHLLFGHRPHRGAPGGSGPLAPDHQRQNLPFPDHHSHLLERFPPGPSRQAGSHRAGPHRYPG